MYAPCLAHENLYPLLIKAKKSNFETTVLRHTMNKVFLKLSTNFECPIKSSFCTNCHHKALDDYQQKFVLSKK